MLKFKLGVLIGFALGWAVGTGRAEEFWKEFWGSRGRPPTSATGPTGPRTTVSSGDSAMRRGGQVVAGS
jgi:hypothetical protein